MFRAQHRVSLTLNDLLGLEAAY
ncbi:hypothetical protein PSEUDO9AZ_11284 [Pseudomonas sp. 9AZ]|nr:hypothetical protein PSEUDO9AZ_11284 [Pseudomonas sp. 9AZ]